VFLHELFLELDALALEEEEEGTSYLADLNKVPDFVDEPPVEAHQVSIKHPRDLGHAPDDGPQSPAPHEALKTTW
jgi:hypothetical protein